MKKTSLLLIFAGALLTSCASSSASSSSSSVPAESMFAQMKTTGEVYSSQNRTKFATEDLNFNLEGYDIYDGEDKPYDFSLEAKDFKISGALNNRNGSTAKKLQGALNFEEGSLNVNYSRISDVGFNYSRFRPNFYFSDYTAYIDISTNSSLRLLVNQLVNALQAEGSSEWSFPSKGKGYAEITPHSIVDSIMPLSGDSSTTTAWTNVLKDHYKDDYKSSYTFVQSEEGNSITFANTDKTILQQLILEEYDASVGEEETEATKKVRNSIIHFFDAATFNAFSLGFQFNESVWTGYSFELDVDMDETTQKEDNPDTVVVLKNIELSGHFSLSVGEEARISFPEDLGKADEDEKYSYVKIDKPNIELPELQ